MNTEKAMFMNGVEIGRSIFEAEKGVFIGFFPNNKTLFIILVDHNLAHLKYYGQIDKTMEFFFEEDNGEGYSFKRKLNDNELMYLKFSKNINITDSINFFEKESEEDEFKYYSFKKQSKQLVEF